MKLIKISYPGWEKQFNSEEELKLELFANICSYCCDGYQEVIDNEVVVEQEPITIESSIDDMLWSACGCEFLVEEDE